LSLLQGLLAIVVGKLANWPPVVNAGSRHHGSADTCGVHPNSFGTHDRRRRRPMVELTARRLMVLVLLTS